MGGRRQRRLVLLFGGGRFLHRFVALSERQRGLLRRDVLAGLIDHLLGLVFLLAGAEKLDERNPCRRDLGIEFHGATECLFGVGQQRLGFLGAFFGLGRRPMMLNTCPSQIYS